MVRFKSEPTPTEGPMLQGFEKLVKSKIWRPKNFAERPMIASDSSKQKCKHKAQNDKRVTFGTPSQDPCEKKAAAKFTLKRNVC